MISASSHSGKLPVLLLSGIFGMMPVNNTGVTTTLQHSAEVTSCKLMCP